MDLEAACQVFRNSFRPLYESFPLLSLQLSVAVFTMITADKIVNAEGRDGGRDILSWDELAAQLLSGVLVSFELFDWSDKCTHVTILEGLLGRSRLWYVYEQYFGVLPAN